ncbi:guanylate kinase [Dethiosulfatibacter aminovorans DSM 17477]|uniref:Guanylate kinase n=1 Tax=Dethiosulfatibacter aminovorans DSM 17477 TaxID=1121476 RepID=A0A1M6DJ57_9FIRM|nr:guanylate kinase [Dethiosulfatibacter aminovorans]SHI73222.1 guanylate kinase [Dethiosulfatibacter aminovorans DSM 17477]
MTKGLLIVVSGPSGAGKGTLCKELIRRNNEIELSISCTTRDPRGKEVDGVNYYFISTEEFESRIENNDFLEYAQVYGNYYGTPKWKVLELIDKGVDVILEIDIQGALKVKEEYPDGVFVFVLPPSLQELKERITSRGTDSKDAIIKRMDCAYEELSYAFKYDYAIVNDYVESAVDKIEAIITAEENKANRQKQTINSIREN